MEYLFLKRKKASFVSQRQKDLLFDAAEKQWRKEFVAGGIETRKVDLDIYKSLLYFLEIKQVFLDPKLSLKKLSMMIETNQTYLSNVINRYFGCCLKKLVNSYRIEYAKELLRAGNCPLKELPQRSGFTSKSAFYAAFGRQSGYTPKRYMTYNWKNEMQDN